MKALLCAFLPLLPAVFLQAAEVTGIPDTEEAERKAGFVRLDHGADFTGWEHPGNWVIEEGAFHRRSWRGSNRHIAKSLSTACRRPPTPRRSTANWRSW